MRWFRKERSMRRIFLGGAFAATLAAGVMLGTLIPSQQVEAQPQVAFSGDAAVMLHFVKPGSTSAYEGVMARSARRCRGARTIRPTGRRRPPVGRSTGPAWTSPVRGTSCTPG